MLSYVTFFFLHKMRTKIYNLHIILLATDCLILLLVLVPQECHEPGACQFERESYLFPRVACGQNIPDMV